MTMLLALSLLLAGAGQFIAVRHSSWIYGVALGLAVGSMALLLNGFLVYVVFYRTSSHCRGQPGLGRGEPRGCN
jgi:hypothetical protein